MISPTILLEGGSAEMPSGSVPERPEKAVGALGKTARDVAVDFGRPRMRLLVLFLSLSCGGPTEPTPPHWLLGNWAFSSETTRSSFCLFNCIGSFPCSASGFLRITTAVSQPQIDGPAVELAGTIAQTLICSHQTLSGWESATPATVAGTLRNGSLLITVVDPAAVLCQYDATITKQAPATMLGDVYCSWTRPGAEPSLFPTESFRGQWQASR